MGTTDENIKVELGFLNKDIGIRAYKSIIPQIANENVYKPNLITDIAYVDYTEDSRGYTTLQPLDGLPLFIDDLYIYKYIHMNELEKNPGGGVRLKVGENLAASNTVKMFEAITSEVFGVRCSQKITHTVNLEKGLHDAMFKSTKVNSLILQTLLYIIRRMEDDALAGY